MQAVISPVTGGRVNARWLTRHGIFAALLAVGVALRVVTALGYRGALWFSDSFDYVDTARRLYPHQLRPDGYAFWLLVLRPFGSFTLVTATQHLMGLAIGVLVYVIACRRGVRRWVAALAAAPVLLDAYEIQLEHIVLSDTFFAFLIVLAAAILLWNPAPPGTGRAAAVGLVLALATLTRTLGLPLLLVFAGYLLFWPAPRSPAAPFGTLRVGVFARAGWKPLTAVATACLVPLAAYGAWFAAWYGSFALSGADGAFAYGRTTTFVNCADMPDRLRTLCPREPVGERPAPQHYIWDKGTPLDRAFANKFSPGASAVERDFAMHAIMADPGGYARTVATDTLRTFAPGRPVFPDRATYDLYRFPSQVTQDWAATRGSAAASTARYGGGITTHVVQPYAGFLRAYQNVVALPGPLLAVIIVAGAALIAVRRAWPAALPWCLGVALLLAPPAVAEFDYRYVLPAVPLLCLALALATVSRPVRTEEAQVGDGSRLSRGSSPPESVTS